MPSYSSGLGRFVKRDARTSLKASGAETSSTTGTAMELGDAGSLVVTVDVTAASGTTPTMVVDIEGSADGSNWFPLGQFGANGYRSGSVGTAPSNFTAAATTRGAVTGAPYVRHKSTIGGTTPSFTYSITVSAA
ncbi:hypothetical protein [Streptomyces sp. NPDC015131]|uniref:hypothetical protein n=1 Tax=Streptomyces sp. NPDC015131 TaxID=3364941 RepID=UPI0036F54F83